MLLLARQFSVSSATMQRARLGLFLAAALGLQ